MQTDSLPHHRRCCILFPAASCLETLGTLWRAAYKNETLVIFFWSNGGEDRCTVLRVRGGVCLGEGRQQGHQEGQLRCDSVVLCIFGLPCLAVLSWLRLHSASRGERFRGDGLLFFSGVLSPTVDYRYIAPLLRSTHVVGDKLLGINMESVVQCGVLCNFGRWMICAPTCVMATALQHESTGTRGTEERSCLVQA